MTPLASLFAAAFSLIWVDPYGDNPYLPDAFPKGGVETNLVSLAAARGDAPAPGDQGFVARNINKGILGAGDARLIARGRYAWRDRKSVV